MKKVFAWLLVLTLLCMPVSAMAVNSETANEKSALFNVRYYFEHRLLPSLYFENPEAYISFYETNGIFSLWNAYTEFQDFDTTYTADEFEVRNISPVEDIILLMLKMPEPEETPFCFRIYLYYDQATGTAAYFTIEFDNFFDECAYLCAWTKDMTHLNYVNCKLFRPGDPDYESLLKKETEEIMRIAILDDRQHTVFDPETGVLSQPE